MRQGVSRDLSLLFLIDQLEDAHKLTLIAFLQVLLNLGAKVVSVSDSSGCLVFKDGMT